MTNHETNIRMTWMDDLKPVAQDRIQNWTDQLRRLPLIRTGAIALQLSDQPLDIVVTMLAVLLKERAGKPGKPPWGDVVPCQPDPVERSAGVLP